MKKVITEAAKRVFWMGVGLSNIALAFEDLTEPSSTTVSGLFLEIALAIFMLGVAGYLVVYEAEKIKEMNR